MLGLPPTKVQNVEYIVSVRGMVQWKYESIIQDKEVKQTKTEAKSKPSKHISYPLEVAINWANLKGLSIIQNESKGLIGTKTSNNVSQVCTFCNFFWLFSSFLEGEMAELSPKSLF